MWDFGLFEPGRYQVFVWNSAALGEGRSIVRNYSAEYVIANAITTMVTRINQNVDAGGWVTIGEFDFKGDGTEGVSVIAGGVSTVADAVRLVRVDP